MTEQIRFSQHVIDCLKSEQFRAQPGEYSNARWGFRQKDKADNDYWELWAWRDWPFRKVHISLSRRGEYLNYLTKDEEKALWEAYQTATALAELQRDERRAAEQRKREANHWWP